MKTKALSHKKEREKLSHEEKREKLSHEEKARLVIDYARKDLITYCQVIDPSYRANWHHELIAEKLMAVERGDIRRLMIFSPPRHGKSRLITEIFPTWYLGKNTSGEVITASNTEDLAKDFGRKAREIIKEPVYKAIFGLSLRADEKGSGKWKTEKGGSYTSVGIGGTITGRGATLCFPKGVKVKTDTGEKNIEDCKKGERVLSYNNDTNTIEYKRIVGTLKRTHKRFVEVASSCGNRVVATDNHPFFIAGKGYIEAKRLKKEERVWIFKGEEKCSSYLFSLQKTISKRLGGIYKKSQDGRKGYVLFKRMFGKTSFFQKQQEMPLRENNQKNKKILFEVLYAFEENIKRHSLSFLSKTISTIKQIYQVLFNGLQEQFSFQENVGRKSKLQTRFGNECLSERVPKNEISRKEGQKQKMYNLFFKEIFSSSSQRLQSKEQREDKSCFGVQKLPYNSSQVEEHTISSVTTFEREQEVYDIEVEDNHNFFANGFLVHNCIIDDPIKNAEDAQSILFRNKQWDWYRSVLYTRLMNREGKQGAIVIVLTRWHNDDLAGRLLEQMAEGTGDNWDVLSLPAIAEEDEKFRKSGEALWEEEFPLKRLHDTKRIVGPYVWNSLYQQKPISSENQLFVDSWFKYRDASEVDALSTRNFLTIDTAVSEIGDYTGFCDNRVDTQNMWNIRAWRERIKPNDLLDKLFYLHHTNRYEKIGIEKTIYKQAIQPFLDDEMRKRNQFLPIVELSHGGKAKEERIKWLVPRYSSGSIYHVRGLTSDLEEELLQFPKAKYDDVCLAGETIVATEFGDKKISDIRKGDKVITPFGLRKVLWAGKTGEKEVIQRRGIVGTKNHRIFSGKHFDNLDAITYNSNVSVFSLKNTIVWMYKKLLFSMEKPSALWEGRESIILVNQKTGKILKDFTLRFGNFIRRRKFLLAIVFTIKTAILIITALKIWIVYKVANTFHTILRKIGQKTERKNSKILEKQENYQRNGTLLKKERNGIANTQKKLHTEKKKSIFVKNAKGDIHQQSKERLNFVQKDVKTDTTQENLERKTRIITVYNIEVEEDGVFYAENILVSNCDATAYQAQIASASMESNWDEEAFQELSLNTDW